VQTIQCFARFAIRKLGLELREAAAHDRYAALDGTDCKSVWAKSSPLKSNGALVVFARA
jgi:hypothetical protein